MKAFCRLCRRLWFYLALFFCFIWLPAFVWFYQQIPIREEAQGFAAKTDAIVVLTGGQGRFDAGLKLLVEGKAKELLVSGVDKNVKPHELAEMYDIKIEQAGMRHPAQIALDHGPHNTVGNSQSTAVWMQQKGFKSLRLVTSSYHMPRSLMEFRRAMPDMTILPEPVFPAWGTLDKVLLVSRGSLRLILLEFHKYMIKRAYYALPPSWQIFSSSSGGMNMPDISLITVENAS